MAKTYDIKGAAEFLKMSVQAACAEARKGNIKGAKIGRRWVFIEEDLVDCVRSRYKKPAELTTRLLNGSSKACHSTKEKTSGGSDFLTVDREYAEAVGLPTN